MSTEIAAPNALVKQQQSFKQMIEGEGVRSAIASVLPKHVTPERLLKTVLLAASRNPAIYRCTRDSILRCVIQAAELGLEPGSSLGTAYLVPYGAECTLIPSYRGLVELAIRTGEVKSVQARAVYAKDRLEIVYGLDEKLEHVPSFDADPGALVAVYAVAVLTNGSKLFEFMPIAAVNLIRARSKSSSSGPWTSDPDAMALKTVVRRLCTRTLPKSPEFRKALEMEEDSQSTSREILPSAMPIFESEASDADSDPTTLRETLLSRIAAASTTRELNALAGDVASAAGRPDDDGRAALDEAFAARALALRPANGRKAHG